MRYIDNHVSGVIIYTKTLQGCRYMQRKAKRCFRQLCLVQFFSPESDLDMLPCIQTLIHTPNGHTVVCAQSFRMLRVRYILRTTITTSERDHMNDVIFILQELYYNFICILVNIIIRMYSCKICRQRKSSRTTDRRQILRSGHIRMDVNKATNNWSLIKMKKTGRCPISVNIASSDKPSSSPWTSTATMVSSLAVTSSNNSPP